MDYKHNSGKQQSERSSEVLVVSCRVMSWIVDRSSYHGWTIIRAFQISKMSVESNKTIKEDATNRVWNSVPECLHVHGGLEHKEYMSVVVRVDFFAIRTKVLSAERTAVPLSNDTHHVPIAKGKCMLEIA